MRRLLGIAAACLACSVQAQGFDIGRMLDLGRKVVTKGAEATREFSTEEEIVLGESAAASFLGASPLHQDAELQRYVNRVGRWLASHSGRPDLPWTFGVMDTETLNAFAMPGGSILVSSGLVKRLASESELAGVLAHEIAHVVKRHQVAAIQSAARGDFWGTLGKEVLAEGVARRGGSALTQQGRTLLGNLAADLVRDGFFLRPLDRAMEYEADQLAVVIATRAGYDPYGFVAALQMLAQHKEGGDAASVFSTHPPAADRLGELEQFLPALERFASQPRVEDRFRQSVGGLR